MTKPAGAPKVPAAGPELHIKLGDRVERGMPLFAVHAKALGKLDYTFDCLEAHPLVNVGNSR